MEQRFLIDTNVVIDALGAEMPAEPRDFIGGMTPIVSAVTYMEALGWHKASPQQLAPLQAFLSAATVLPIDQTVVNKTVLIRQQKKIGLGDAIIAAAALLHDLILLTRNTGDFKDINGLKTLNPWQIK